MFTGVDYSFDDTVINLSRGLALLNNIGIRDGRENSRGSISGSIQFETLSSLGVNLIMRADNCWFLILRKMIMIFSGEELLPKVMSMSADLFPDWKSRHLMTVSEF
jgi:hypothetical protein